MKIAFSEIATPAKGVVAVVVTEERTLGATGRGLDEQTGGALSRALAAGRFKGKQGTSTTIVAPHGLDVDAVILVGLGKPEKIDGRGLRATWRWRRPQDERRRREDRRHRRGRGRRRIRGAASDGGGDRPGRAPRQLQLRQVPHQEEGRGQEESGRARGDARRSGGGGGRVRGEREPCRRRLHRARPRLRAEQRQVSQDHRRRHRGADRRRDRGRAAGPRQDGLARHGLAAGRRPGQRPRALSRGHALERGAGRHRTAASRLHRQGRHLRYRRHLHQAGPGHGGDEVRHGRLGDGGRPDEVPGRPQGAGQR